MFSPISVINISPDDLRAVGAENLNSFFQSINERYPEVYRFESGDVLPFRLRVQQALTIALRQIHPDNGFCFDLTDPRSIIRGRVEFSEQDIPENGTNISILEEPFSYDRDFRPCSSEANTEPYGMIVQGFTPDDPHHPTDRAQILLSDVRKRLAILKRDEGVRGQRVFRIGTKENSVIGVDFDGGIVRPEENASRLCHFWLRVSFDISEDFNAPGG